MMLIMTFVYTAVIYVMIPEAGKQEVSTFFKEKFEYFSQKPTKDRPITNDSPQAEKGNKEQDLNYNIKANLDEVNYKIKGKVAITFKNPGTTKLLFYTYPYRWTPMNIKKVFVNGREMGFNYDKANLTFKNIDSETVRVVIEFETPIPKSETRFGYNDGVWLLTNWYPMLGLIDEENGEWIKRPNPVGFGDPFYYQFADYTVEWLSSSDIKWVSTGSLMSQDNKTNKKSTMRLKANGVRNFALVGSSAFTIYQLDLNNKTNVTVALKGNKTRKQVDKIIEASFLLFSDVYGELPYENVAIAEIGNNANVGLEYANLALFSTKNYKNQTLEHWLPHEIGHLWWSNAVGVHEVENGWIDEGLAELGVVLYLESRYTGGEAKKLRQDYRTRNLELIKAYPQQKMNKKLTDFKNDWEFRQAWYGRSADMFLTLRETIGDETFYLYLNNLYKSNIGKVANENDVTKALDKTLHVQTDFFANWLFTSYGKGELTVD